jgi:hypothetical protein
VIHEIKQTIWLMTPKGLGRAMFLIDRGDEADLQWVVFQDNKQIWTWENADVMLPDNITMGRT